MHGNLRRLYLHHCSDIRAVVSLRRNVGLDPIRNHAFLLYFCHIGSNPNINEYRDTAGDCQH